MSKKFFARLTEHEEGWGSDVLELKEFPSLEEARAFVIAWNDINIDESLRDAPSYFIRADLVVGDYSLKSVD